MIEETVGMQGSLDEAVQKLRDGLRLSDITYVYELRHIKGLNGEDIESVLVFHNEKGYSFYTMWSLEDWKYQVDSRIGRFQYTLECDEAYKKLKEGKTIASNYVVYFVGRVQGDFNHVDEKQFVFSVHRSHLMDGKDWQRFMRIEDTVEKFHFDKGSHYMVWDKRIWDR